MASQTFVRAWRATRQGAFGGVFVLGLAAAAQAQDPGSDKLAELIERIDRLERDKQSLEERLDTVEKSAVEERSVPVPQYATLDEPTRQGASVPNL